MLEKIKNLEATISRMTQDFDLEQDRLIEEITNQILQQNISHKGHFTLHQEASGNLSAKSSPNRVNNLQPAVLTHPYPLSPSHHFFIYNHTESLIQFHKLFTVKIIIDFYFYFTHTI